LAILPGVKHVGISLVTGGAGFIGSHLVERLVTSGHRVRVLDDFRTGLIGNLDGVLGNVDVIIGSITHTGTLQSAVRDCDAVFHLAALPSVRRSVEDPAATHEVCATGTLSVLEAARRAGVRRVVYAASSSVYGGSVSGKSRESDLPSPLSRYAAAKFAGELYCRAFTSTYGLDTIRLRFFNVFGPRQRSDSPYSGVIPLFVATMLEGKCPILHGSGEQSRDFTYVSDAVRALERAASAPATSAGRVYNVGGGRTTTILALVQHLEELLGTKTRPVFVPARPGDVFRSEADTARARMELGYEPEMTFPEGLRRTVEAIRDLRLDPDAARNRGA
jgi:UDP-glucose 4-epimerase